MPVGEVIAIGTELLLGEIQDTNTSYIARVFRNAGIDLYRTMIVGDNIERIAQAIRESLSRADIVITTGGLGPTIDDPTRAAAAKAFDTELEFRLELWDQIQARFQRFHRQATDNNRRQAFIPCGATAIENPVGTAPGFFQQNDSGIVICLPGVPREMEHLLQHAVLPILIERFELCGTIKTHILHAAGVGESQVDEWISELETESNPTVGLSCHPGQIDIRVTAKAGSEQEADDLLAHTILRIQQLVGVAIYGSNQDTLEHAVRARLEMHGWSLSMTECGFNGALVNQYSAASASPFYPHILSNDCQAEDLRHNAEINLKQDKADVSLAAGYFPGADQQDLYLFLITPNAKLEAKRSFGGHPASGLTWGVKTALDFVRRNIP